MQKTIVNHLGHKVGTYYPITGKFVSVSGSSSKMDKLAFKAYCDDMEWQTL